MPAYMPRIRKKSGLPPGTVVYTGKKKVSPASISIIDYDTTNFSEKKLDSVEECIAYKKSKTVTWINIVGVHDTDLVKKLCTHYGIHPLVQEDISSISQRPKFEDLEDYLFVVLKMIRYDSVLSAVKVEQISILLGPTWVISFQENECEIFDSIRQRLRAQKGRIRKQGPDYLVYSLMDAIIDHYFWVLEELGEVVDQVQDRLITNPRPDTLTTIHTMKRDLIFLRKSVWPLREVVSSMQRSETKLIHPGTDIFLRDIYDHTIQVIDSLESFRDMVSGQIDVYLSSVSNKMNEVMKVLTIIATIFIPLTFIAGVYGMNFNYMPELNFKYSYFIVWGIMLVVVALMLGFFKKKKWI